MNNGKIEYTLLRVGEDIVARFGERLMVVNNIVIGVYTGDPVAAAREVEKVPPAAVAAPAAAPKAPQVANPTPKGGYVKAKVNASPEARRRYYAETRETLLAAIPVLLKERPYLNLADMAKHFGYKRGDEIYQRLASTLRDMRTRDQLMSQRMGLSNVSVVYYLPDQPPPSAKASTNLFSSPQAPDDSAGEEQVA